MSDGTMTATEELRRLLDERGVEHLDVGGMTEFTNGGGRICRAYTRPEPLTVDVAVLAILPEQAVEATLGRGTCTYEIAAFGDGRAWFECSECGGMASADYDPPTYCPHCGRKVVGA